MRPECMRLSIDKCLVPGSASHCGAVALFPGKNSESPWRRTLARYATSAASLPQAIGTRPKLLVLNDLARWWSGVTMHVVCVIPTAGSIPSCHTANFTHTPARYVVPFDLIRVDSGPSRSCRAFALWGHPLLLSITVVEYVTRVVGLQI